MHPEVRQAIIPCRNGVFTQSRRIHGRPAYAELLQQCFRFSAAPACVSGLAYQRHPSRYAASQPAEKPGHLRPVEFQARRQLNQERAQFRAKSRHFQQKPLQDRILLMDEASFVSQCPRRLD
jgi:hypothetical protein